MKTFRQFITELSDDTKKRYIKAAESSRYTLSKRIAGQWAKEALGLKKDRPDKNAVRKWGNRTTGISRASK